MKDLCESAALYAAEMRKPLPMSIVSASAALAVARTNLAEEALRHRRICAAWVAGQDCGYWGAAGLQMAQEAELWARHVVIRLRHHISDLRGGR